MRLIFDCPVLGQRAFVRQRVIPFLGRNSGCSVQIVRLVDWAPVMAMRVKADPVAAVLQNQERRAALAG